MLGRIRPRVLRASDGRKCQQGALIVGSKHGGQNTVAEPSGVQHRKAFRAAVLPSPVGNGGEYEIQNIHVDYRCDIVGRAGNAAWLRRPGSEDNSPPLQARRYEHLWRTLQLHKRLRIPWPGPRLEQCWSVYGMGGYIRVRSLLQVLR